MLRNTLPFILPFTFNSYCRRIDALGLLGGSDDKESTRTGRDLGLILGLGSSAGEGNGYPLQYSDLENSMDCRVHGVTGHHWVTFTSLVRILSSSTEIRVYKLKLWQPTIISFPSREPWNIFAYLKLQDLCKPIPCMKTTHPVSGPPPASQTHVPGLQIFFVLQ